MQATCVVRCRALVRSLRSTRHLVFKMTQAIPSAPPHVQVYPRQGAMAPVPVPVGVENVEVQAFAITWSAARR
jgi:hypothetical protein